MSKRKLQVGSKVQIRGISHKNLYWDETFKKHVGKFGKIICVWRLTKACLVQIANEAPYVVPMSCLKTTK